MTKKDFLSGKPFRLPHSVCLICYDKANDNLMFANGANKGMYYAVFFFNTIYSIRVRRVFSDNWSAAIKLKNCK